MKKLFYSKVALAALMITLVFGARAQDFSLSPKTFEVSGSATSEQHLQTVMTNNSSTPGDTMFNWKIIELSSPSQWDLQFCDPVNCLSGLTIGQNSDFKLTPGQNGVLLMSFFFNGTHGISNMKIVIRSKMNPSNADTIVYKASTWTTGINEASKGRDISFYPNPAKDQITFRFASSQSLRVDIYNVLGTKVKSFNHDGSATSVNVGDLKNGVYFFRFSDGNNTYSKQFTKSE